MSLENSPNFLLYFSERDVRSGERHFYRFRSFQLDVEERQLLQNNLPVSMTPKVFDVLAVLVESNGHLVGKDELLRVVWADSFVEEANIARIIHTLRKVLGDDGNGNKFIETIAKKGYRFVAEVNEVYVSDLPEPQNGTPNASTINKHSAENKAQNSLTLNDETISLKISEQKHTARIFLLAVGFLIGFFLFLLLIIDFKSINVQSVTSLPQSKVKSIAVLPLKPVDTKSRDEIYEIGIAESMIYRIGSMKGFVVRPLSATRQYTDINQNPIAAGREQRADYVLASNYQLGDGKIRVTAQLINVASGQVEENYKSEKVADDLFGMQDAIANEVGNKLSVRFSTTLTTPASARGTIDEEAYRLYLQGENLTARQSTPEALKAVEYFEQAIRLDPNFARAYAGLARAYITLGVAGGALPRVENEKATEALKKALELDNNLAEAYAVSGKLKVNYEWNFTEAKKDLLRAIELEPNNDSAHWFYAELLAYSGHFDEALAEIEITLGINPNSLPFQRDRGRILFYAHRYDEAIVQLNRVVELDDNFETAWGYLFLSYELKGDEAHAYEAFLKFQKRMPERTEVYQAAYETAGWRAVRRKLLEFSKLDENKPGSNLFAIARQCALLGEKNEAFEYLNKAFEKHQMQMVMLKVEPSLDALRDDPRFDELVTRIGL
jgi:DNA-binding winged helix-turn-helix (wHTH) protein/tetratricopeptide (TPR) repeat protein